MENSRLLFEPVSFQVQNIFKDYLMSLNQALKQMAANVFWGCNGSEEGNTEEATACSF